VDRDLEGIRVLVVEDRAPVAMALCDRLMDHGAAIVGPAAKLPQATELAEGGAFDIAILDVDLDGVYTFPLARALAARAVPVVLMTGYDARTIPEDLRGLPLFDKLGSIGDPTRILLGLVHAE